LKEVLGGGLTLSRTAFAGETNNGGSGLELNCSFIAAYCDLSRFDPVGLLQCSSLARWLRPGRTTCASKLEGPAQVLAAKRLKASCRRRTTVLTLARVEVESCMLATADGDVAQDLH